MPPFSLKRYFVFVWLMAVAESINAVARNTNLMDVALRKCPGNIPGHSYRNNLKTYITPE
jgi:hypothetical protein